MKRGFPRPKVKASDSKLYPQPYVSKYNRVAEIANTRQEECNKKFLCNVCGEYIEGTKACVVVSNRRSSFSKERVISGSDTGLSHIKCGKLTALYCPLAGSHYKLFVVSLARFKKFYTKYRGTSIGWKEFSNGHERLLKL